MFESRNATINFLNVYYCTPKNLERTAELGGVIYKRTTWQRRNRVNRKELHIRTFRKGIRHMLRVEKNAASKSYIP